MDERTEQLRQIREEVMNLTQSPLYEYRVENNYFPVIGQGNHFAKIMFIGEAPGENLNCYRRKHSIFWRIDK